MLKSFVREAARRRVFRTVGVYLFGLWLAAQGVADLFPALGLPEWSVRAFIYAGVAFTIPVAILSWVFDLTFRGLVRDGAEPTARFEPTGRPAHATGPMDVEWTDTDGKRKVLTFSTPFLLGRDVQADVSLDDRRVSRHQARFYPKDGQWRVVDLDSSNGTWIDGKRIKDANLPQTATLHFDADKKGPALRVRIQRLEATEVLVT
ncbi:MAG: FHA domain-containing protein [Pseudomonadota bacterium]